MRQTEVVVVAGRREARDALLSAAASVGIEPTVLAEPPQSARGLVVLAEPEAARAVPLPGADVLVVGDDPGTLARAASRLRARIVCLPQDADALVEAFAGGSAAGEVVAVVGGSGGVGASTLAAGLAEHLGGALVELDECGGGADLVLGLEGRPGWRWPALAHARGMLSGLAERLPGERGVVAVARERGAGGLPGGDAVRAVIDALRVERGAVVLDAGRGQGHAAAAGLQRAGRVLLVVGCRVGQVAAAESTAARLRAGGLAPEIVVAAGPGASPTEVAAALGADRFAVLPRDPALARAMDAGESPLPAGGRAWGRAVASIAAGG